MEVTQYTYFQQAGGIDLKPISVELTYGLERIAMYLQDVENVYDLEWAPGVRYREICRPQEIEWSRYNFEEADVAWHQTVFDKSESECKRLLAAGLVLPAYDFVVKASHAFNVLDARGAMSTTERARTILRVRDLARACAEAYLESRRALGFPLGRADGALAAP